MHLALNEEQELLRDTFAQLFSTESSPERVRAAEETGFDEALWKHLVETGAIGIRVPEDAGGAGATLFDAVLLAEQAGRHLVSAPLVEGIAVSSALSKVAAASGVLAEAVAGSRILSLALREGSGAQLVPGGAVADAVLGLDGDALVLASCDTRTAKLPNLAGAALAEWDLAVGERTILASGAEARDVWERAREEWRLLTATLLGGIGRRALEIGAAYSVDRVQFDRPIGSFQAIAHPLADSAMEIEGGQVLVWRAVESIARGRDDAATLVALALGWLADAVPRGAHRALHTHGGYGLSLEYDIQLYHRRAKTTALLAGSPGDAYLAGADRAFRGVATGLPEFGPGELGIDFGLGEKAEEFRAEVRAFLAAHPVSEEHRVRRHSFEGHDPEFHRAMAKAGLLFASWPTEYGGQNRDPWETSALAQELERAGRTVYTISTTRMVAETLMKFGSEVLKREVLPRIAAGEALCSLGYTEPGSGSDVAAAVTRAVRDGDEWVINGQKMFTSGADIGDYVFLLTRTNTEVRKHQGLTMFLVPLDTPGVDIQPIHTLSDERTNATYYSDARVPDRYRVGEIDGGWSVIGYALKIEHGSGVSGGTFEMMSMIDTVVAWAREHGRLDNERMREGLGFALAEAEVAGSLVLRGSWCGITGQPDRGENTMGACIRKRAFVDVADRLMALTAPDSVLSRGAASAIGGGALEFGYRHGTALAIYGGTEEILKSIVAQTALGMPRSRS